MVFIIHPFGEREIRYLALAIFVWVIVVLAFGVFGATVFAEPAVTQVEEVCRLMHVRSQIADPQIPESGIRDLGSQNTEQIRPHEQNPD